MKIIAHCIHHTHWDPIWYFHAEDALVQLAYDVRELLDSLESEECKAFFFDGQTAALEDYLRLHPEAEARVRALVTAGKLILGPFHSQLDGFISSGESLVNNLRLGIRFARRLGKCSGIAYLPDSFGHSADYPAVFRSFGLRDFVFTRGAGDEQRVGNEFLWRSKDGSEVLSAVMTAGYGYGTKAFREGTLGKGTGSDYNRRGVESLIAMLLRKSTLPGEFVLPLGFDQNPVIPGLTRRIAEANRTVPNIEFRETTWKEYLDRVRERVPVLPVYSGELDSPQHHRIHRSVFSVRADIKTIQDRVERRLTYEVQPLIGLMDVLGLPWDQALLDRAWELLIRGQTHAGATMTEDSNGYVHALSVGADHLSDSLKGYLMKILVKSLPPRDSGQMPLTIFRVRPVSGRSVMPLTVYSASPEFRILESGREIPYWVTASETFGTGHARKDPRDEDPALRACRTKVWISLDGWDGMGYRTLVVEDGRTPSLRGEATSPGTSVENEFLRVESTPQGIRIIDKPRGLVHEGAIRWEDSGDDGDSYDHSVPPNDLLVRDRMGEAVITGGVSCPLAQELLLRGSFQIPSNLKARAAGIRDASLSYELRLQLIDGDPVLHLDGWVDNPAMNHRLRLVFPTGVSHAESVAGTQFGVIRRKTADPMEKTWREAGWFEEPRPIYPLLNFVSAENGDHVLSIHTRGPKEYEFSGSGASEISVTLFRAVGHLGLPDLSCRPGRPSGLDYKIVETPGNQMPGKTDFSLGIGYSSVFDAGSLWNRQADFSTDPCYFQDQPWERTVFPVAYFPTNPLSRVFPDRFRFLAWKETPAVFGTMAKDESDGALLVHVFNPGEAIVPGGFLETGFSPKSVFLTDLEGTRRTPCREGKLPDFRPGEIRVIGLKLT